MEEKRNIPFSPPDVGEEEIREIAEAVRSGWITTGPRTKEFEKRIAEYCGVNRAVCLNSATACLESILRVLEIGPGDEVITSAYTYTASASPVCHVGAKLVLADISKENLEMDYDRVEKLITEKTKAIIPVDIGGIPCDYDRLLAIAEEKKHLFRPSSEIQEAMGRIAVISDGAHAFGAEYHGKKCGSVADFTSFSFHAVKNLTTAEGGALTWKHIEGIDDDRIYQQFMLLSLHGQSKDALAKTKLGAWEYDIVSPAYKCNMTDITAAIGLVQLSRYPELIRRRREVIGMYDRMLKPADVEIMAAFCGRILLPAGICLSRGIPEIGEKERNEIIVHLAERGIATNVHYKPLPMMTAYQKLGFDIADFPNAHERYKNEITLPLHTKLTDKDVEYVNLRS